MLPRESPGVGQGRAGGWRGASSTAVHSILLTVGTGLGVVGHQGTKGGCGHQSYKAPCKALLSRVSDVQGSPPTGLFLFARAFCTSISSFGNEK